MGFKPTQRWPEWERTAAAIASPMFWWSISRRGSIRTRCDLPFQIVKHLNQGKWWLYKAWVSSKIMIFDGAQIYTVLTWVRRNFIEPKVLVRPLTQRSSIRTTCNVPLQVVKHPNQRRWWLYKVRISWDRSLSRFFFTTLLLLLSSCGTFRLASTGPYINSTSPERKSHRRTALAGFEPVTMCFRDCFKMPGELRGAGRFQVKNHRVGLRFAPPLAEARVTQLATASFRANIHLNATIVTFLSFPTSYWILFSGCCAVWFFLPHAMLFPTFPPTCCWHFLNHCLFIFLLISSRNHDAKLFRFLCFMLRRCLMLSTSRYAAEISCFFFTVCVVAECPLFISCYTIWSCFYDANRPVPPVKAIGVPYIMLRYVFLFEMLHSLILSSSFYAASPRSIRPVVWRFPYPYFLPSLIKFSACCLILSSTRYAAWSFLTRYVLDLPALCWLVLFMSWYMLHLIFVMLHCLTFSTSCYASWASLSYVMLLKALGITV